MSFRGAILICLVLLLPATGVFAAVGDEAFTLSFNYVISEGPVVQQSQGMVKTVSAFVDTNGDKIYDKINFDGEEIDVTVETADAQGFSFADGTKIAFYPTNISSLPQPGTYGVIGFIKRWGDFGSRVMALLVHQDENYQTSEGITVYLIDRGGVRVGSIFYAFWEKAGLRYLTPYQKWMQTGNDFAIGTSPTVSNYMLMGKDMGLVDTVLIMNIAFTSGPETGQDFDLRKPDEAVAREGLNLPGDWGAFSGETADNLFNTVKVDGETVNSNLMSGRAQGLTFRDGRKLVFYPSGIRNLPAAPSSGTNWELLGFIHYFTDDGIINSLLAVMIGQAAGDNTTSGTQLKVIDNTGVSVGLPSYQFYAQRMVKLMGSYQNWDTASTDYSLGFNEGSSGTIYIVKDLNLVDKLLVLKFDLY